MSTTVKEIIKSLEGFPHLRKNKKTSLAEEFLGKFKEILPKGKSSSDYIRELRSTLYGKIK